MIKRFQKIAVIGTGLIGGSLALALKKKRLGKKIVGISRHRSSLTWAKKIRAVDEGSLSLAAAKGADLVVLALPVELIIEKGNKLAGLLAPGCVVFDVASTKLQIVRQLTAKIPGFVGTHPLAGSEKRGIQNASAGLFRGSLCVITPDKKTDRRALSLVKEIWQRLGARVKVLSAAEHDRILAAVSHLPHLAAFALINSVSGKDLVFAASGLKDTTRIAASDSRLWQEILLANRSNCLNALRSYQGQLSLLEKALRKNDRGLLLKVLSAAKRKRERLG